ncbi:hypothetical protein BDA99DRAFT_592967 [Phascolomyces articulosus]|uniref:Uncharacterized protein n=1 Tax=Phascolomyces articulosus TaxID=60185 RepID=A0AAD5KJ04_9FUNG|nr:hypothetical protein BDA99DRAFT_592967 [Phascolomyces articulosus]
MRMGLKGLHCFSRSNEAYQENQDIGNTLQDGNVDILFQDFRYKVVELICLVYDGERLRAKSETHKIRKSRQIQAFRKAHRLHLYVLSGTIFDCNGSGIKSAIRADLQHLVNELRGYVDMTNNFPDNATATVYHHFASYEADSEIMYLCDNIHNNRIPAVIQYHRMTTCLRAGCFDILPKEHVQIRKRKPFNFKKEIKSNRITMYYTIKSKRKDQRVRHILALDPMDPILLSSS